MNGQAHMHGMHAHLPACLPACLLACYSITSVNDVNLWDCHLIVIYYSNCNYFRTFNFVRLSYQSTFSLALSLFRSLLRCFFHIYIFFSLFALPFFLSIFLRKDTLTYAHTHMAHLYMYILRLSEKARKMWGAHTHTHEVSCVTIFPSQKRNEW